MAGLHVTRPLPTQGTVTQKDMAYIRVSDWAAPVIGEQKLVSCNAA